MNGKYLVLHMVLAVFFLLIAEKASAGFIESRQKMYVVPSLSSVVFSEVYPLTPAPSPPQPPPVTVGIYGSFDLVSRFYDWGETWISFENIQFGFDSDAPFAAFPFPTGSSSEARLEGTTFALRACDSPFPPLPPGTHVFSPCAITLPTPYFDGVFDGDALTMSGYSPTGGLFDDYFTYDITATVSAIPGPPVAVLFLLVSFGLLWRAYPPYQLASARRSPSARRVVGTAPARISFAVTGRP